METNKAPFTGNFDPLARPYRALELLAFGTALEQTRFHFLDRLKDCQRVAIFGDGDGRFLRRLLDLSPRVQVDCVDTSAVMQGLAASRLTADERSRVRFILGDARRVVLPQRDYDAVATCFFLDCFNDDEAAAIVSRTSAHLRPEALWLFADFVLPPAGWRRFRAELWLALLYRSFGWVTGLQNRRLPNSERILDAEGFVAVSSVARQAGMLRTTLYRRRVAGH